MKTLRTPSYTQPKSSKKGTEYQGAWPNGMAFDFDSLIVSSKDCGFDPRSAHSQLTSGWVFFCVILTLCFWSARILVFLQWFWWENTMVTVIGYKYCISLDHFSFFCPRNLVSGWRWIIQTQYGFSCNNLRSRYKKCAIVSENTLTIKKFYWEYTNTSLHLSLESRIAVSSCYAILS